MTRIVGPVSSLGFLRAVSSSTRNAKLQFVCRTFQRFWLLPRRFVPGVEVREKIDNFVICADVPGFTENDVTIDVPGNRLTISGKRDEVQRDEWTYERSYGYFAWSFKLPEGTMSDQIDAGLETSVLQARIPKLKGEESTKIRVKGAGVAQLHGRIPASNVRS